MERAPPTGTVSHSGEPNFRTIKHDRDFISTTGLSFKVKFLGMAVIGGSECEYWQGAAHRTLSTLTETSTKWKPLLQFTISPTRVHLTSLKPEPWSLLHDHPFEDITYWFYDVVDITLFAYCIKTLEPRVYEVYCFKTIKKSQTGKRLNYAFNFASGLWGTLQTKHRAEVDKLRIFLDGRKAEREMEIKAKMKRVRENERLAEEAKREQRERTISCTVSWSSGPALRKKSECWCNLQPKTMSELLGNNLQSYLNKECTTCKMKHTSQTSVAQEVTAILKEMNKQKKLILERERRKLVLPPPAQCTRKGLDKVLERLHTAKASRPFSCSPSKPAQYLPSNNDSSTLEFSTQLRPKHCTFYGQCLEENDSNDHESKIPVFQVKTALPEHTHEKHQLSCVSPQCLRFLQVSFPATSLRSETKHCCERSDPSKLEPCTTSSQEKIHNMN